MSGLTKIGLNLKWSISEVFVTDYVMSLDQAITLTVVFNHMTPNKKKILLIYSTSTIALPATGLLTVIGHEKDKFDKSNPLVFWI